MLEEGPNLVRGDAGDRELGQFVLAEERDPVRVDGQRRGAIHDLTQKDELVDVVGDGGMAVPVAIVGCVDNTYRSPREPS